MALTQSRDAIGVVSNVLATRLQLAVGDTVSVGRPEDAISTNASEDKLNLFLYQVDFDPHLRSIPLDSGQVPPLWMVLRYLLTAFAGKESDSIAAQKLLGKGLVALNGLNFIDNNDPALKENPEPLKVTFDSADVDLLSKIMQGSDEKYRLSTAFQVRPIMLATGNEPAYAPAIKTVGPPKPGFSPPEGPGVFVMPSLGPSIADLEPAIFEEGATIVVDGPDLNDVDTVHLGKADIPAAPAADGGMEFVAPATISAGNLPLCVSRLLPGGRRIQSNALLARFLPTLDTVTPGPILGAPGSQTRNVGLAGKRLGAVDDDIFIALYKKDGKKVHMYEAIGSVAQTSLNINIEESQFPGAGTYLLILRVNGVQAVNSPELVWP